MPQLQNKLALIVGAGREPGRGIARRFAREGAQLLLIDRDAAAGDALARELDAPFFHADPSDKNALLAAITQATAGAGRLDILVNAAMEEPQWTRLEELPDSAFEQGFAQGFYSALWAMRALQPLMRANGGGRIVNLGSVYGENVAEYIGAYSAAAEALRALTRTAAQEWGADNILVNVLMPTVDDERFRAYHEQHSEHVDTTLPLVALQRFGDPVEDIGGAAVYLVSDDSRYLTGYTIHADGGYHMAGPVYVPVMEV
ncbi:MAG: putative short chain dehydrogenase [Hydrocarboniphaga sp.]|uniref:SDR family NAD(P)-dependent oxidoreductase n=1 Tax=Hydrocarboniphaga sp. TaxID=2033016 RepID=UPI0026278135|nr:SDR family oxidoreductase [Hydrocarboniphaga sp.]MDB5972450.1 putative short chain dehydrogenase [Hydrocarboniphaga sp.]